MEDSERPGAAALSKMPVEGFLKVTRPEGPALTSEQRVHLIRKGNELFTAGEVEQAKRIFVATGYTDGLIRVGDHFAGQRDFLSAYQMYRMAKARDKADAMVEKLSQILRNWMKE